jgi:phage-related protein
MVQIPWGAVVGALDAVGKVTNPALRNAANAVVPAAQYIANGAGQAAQDVLPLLQDVGGLAKGGAGGSVHFASAAVDAVFRDVADAVAGVANAAGPTLEQMAQEAVPILQQTSNAAKPVIDDVGRAVAPAVAGVIQAAGPAIEGVVQAASPAILGVIDAAKPVVEEAINAAGPALEAAAKNAGTFMEEHPVVTIVAAGVAGAAVGAVAAPAALNLVGFGREGVRAGEFRSREPTPKL